MYKLTFEERNLIIDQIIDDLKIDHKNGIAVSICGSMGFVLACYGFDLLSSSEEFDFLQIPIIKSFGTLWWEQSDLDSRIQYLKANKSAI